MDNILRKIETEDIIFYEENRYDDIDKEKYMVVFRTMQKEGIILSEYDDDLWNGFSDVRKYGIDFRFSAFAYKTHFAEYSNIPINTMRDMLKCFVIFQAGEFVLHTIQRRIEWVTSFITCIGDNKYVVPDEAEIAIVEFLGFIGTPENKAEGMIRLVHKKKRAIGGQRNLAPLITYIAVANEVNDMYNSEISDAEFIHWFPVFFWVNVTFVIPLRATEMCLTPLDCIIENGGKLFIRLRRSCLKKRRRTVYYKVDRDYKIFTYPIPDTKTVQIIKRYVALTMNHPRRFLFDYTKYSVNGMYSLASFNNLLGGFIGRHLIGNHKYDYAKYACGIKEFPLITAGDSRPIAMANLYFQDVGADICRQLADHEKVNTSAGYFTNVHETVYASSVMRFQRKIYEGYEEAERYDRYYTHENTCGIRTHTENGCSSPKRPFSTGNIDDCIANEHIYECLGCRYFHPTQEQLKVALADRKKALDSASRAVLYYMENREKIKIREADFDKIFNEAHTSVIRYKTACDEKAGKELEKWHRKNGTLKV